MPNTAQLSNIAHFHKKLPANARASLKVRALPGGSVAAQATSPGLRPGTRAVYEKQIDLSGRTIQYTKTMYAADGAIIHMTDKLSGEVLE